VEKLENRIDEVEKKNNEILERLFDKKIRVRTNLLTIIVLGIPYIVILAVIEIVKSNYQTFSVASLIATAILVCIPFILTTILGKLRQWIKRKVRACLEKRRDASLD
jgi:hypothetical protein